MTDYEFGSMLYRKRSDMLDAIALDWASAGTGNPNTLQKSFNEMTDAELALDCIESWELDKPSDDGDDESQSDMQRYGYDVDDLTSAFADLRERLPEILKEDE